MMKKAIMTFAAVVFCASTALAALSLDAAKAQGLVGERPDGLIGAVSAPSADVLALVNTTNAERTAKYDSIASKNGTDISQVKALAGKQLIERTPAGQYIQTASGEWLRK